MPETNGSGSVPREQYLRRMEDLVANAYLTRYELMKQLMDPRRSIETECGYPEYGESISARMYKNLYDREPIAARVVEVMPRECWQVQPEVYEDNDPNTVTPFEEDWDGLGASISPSKSWYGQEKGSLVYEYLCRLDILSGIGHFGVLLFGFDDGKNLAEP